jgi:hypothetical protein
MQRLATVVLFCLASPIVSAQSFNIDIGNLTPLPSPTFGAAAAQPGSWNAWTPSLGPMNLVDLSGATTTVTATRTAGFGYDSMFDNTGTLGDDGNLMDDWEDPSTNGTYVISGLTPGQYTVTTYAWASDNPAYVSGVSVNGGPTTNVGGAWSGTYQVGVTHAVDTVTVTAAGTISVNVFLVTTFSTFNGLQITQNGGGTPFTTFCSGDGSGTACPCGNSGIAGNGCASSVSASGAHLAGSGTASISNDTFVLTGTLMPNSSALYFQGTAQTNGGAGAAFGDGLRCAGGSVIRLGTKTNVAGTSSYPSGADLHIGTKGANSAGAVRMYQVWYRNAAAFCTSSTFNLSNGVQTTWIP